TGATLAVHLAIHSIETIVAELSPILGPDCPVAAVWHATWPDERIVRGTPADIGEKLIDNGIERTALLFVGRALAAHQFRDSALYDSKYRRRFRNRAAGPVMEEDSSASPDLCRGSPADRRHVGVCIGTRAAYTAVELCGIRSSRQPTIGTRLQIASLYSE